MKCYPAPETCESKQAPKLTSTLATAAVTVNTVSQGCVPKDDVRRPKRSVEEENES